MTDEKKLTGIVVVCSGKGGVGKTTSIQAIGGGLKTLGAPPDAFLDADYGASLTQAYGYEASQPIAQQWLDGRISFEDALNETDEGIALIPTDASLAAVGKEKTLAWRDRLREIGRRKLLLVDTSDDVMSAPVAAAILAADLLLVPTSLDQKAYRRAYPEISGLLAANRHTPEVIWFATMCARQTQYAAEMEKRIANDGIELLAKIPLGTAAKEAETVSLSVVAAARSSTVSKAYIELARLVYARLRGLQRAHGTIPTERGRQPRAVVV